MHIIALQLAQQRSPAASVARYRCPPPLTARPQQISGDLYTLSAACQDRASQVPEKCVSWAPRSSSTT